MPSFSARIVIQVLKLMGVKKIFAKAPMDYKKLRKMDVKKVPKGLKRKFGVATFRILDSEITSISPKEKAKKLTPILYLHGGAFVSGPSKHHWDSIATIVKKAKRTVWLIDYPKAPEANIHQISENIDHIYEQVLDKFEEAPILMGDSAGGNLILTLTQRLIQRKQPLPKCLIAMSPVVDASMSNPKIREIDKKDPMLSHDGALSAKAMCAKDLDLRDPMMSPLFGNFQGFPPITLFLAGRDILYPDAKLMLAKLREANVSLDLIEEQEMPHVWPVLPIMREAREALNHIIKVIQHHS
ncbi:MAG: alpha/beta hydrolase [Saprospiraceae bacterium]|nr:alpha/beta hydrolase [Saprospiraceae bacterium]